METRFFLFSSLLAASRAIGAFDFTTSLTPPTCKLETYKVSGTAQNRNLTGDPRRAIASLNDYYAFLSQEDGNTTISGAYDLLGYFCAAVEAHPKYKNPLLLFVHGTSYTSTYFSALEAPSISPSCQILNYSWLDYAAHQGFHVLSIDRLGSGQSDHPDPLQVVQQNYQASLLTTLIADLRASHDFIGFVGHSLGSFIGAQIASIDPAAVDAYILTGIAEPSGDLGPAQFAANLTVASDYSPFRFPPETFPPGYIVTANKAVREALFYCDPRIDFDPEIYDRDYDTMGTASLGEAATLTLYTAPEYLGAVFVVLGQHDAIFCGDGTRASANCGNNDEENQATRYIGKYFPKAVRTGTYLQPRSGHDVLLHYTWKEGVIRAHRFLDEC